jgi:arylformamidase
MYIWRAVKAYFLCKSKPLITQASDCHLLMSHCLFTDGCCLNYCYIGAMNTMFDFNRDPAWLDAQLNNRLRVPAFATHLQRWREDSERVRHSLPCTLDLSYTADGTDGPAQTLDVFPAAPNSTARKTAKGAAAPVLVFIHGGYWRGLDKADHSFVAQEFTQAGACVVIPNYALCPAVSIEQIVLQQVQALAWVHRSIAQHGGDASRITVIGHSAGGHLAAMLMCCDWQRVGQDLPARLVRHAMGLSGLYDLAPMMASPYLQSDLRLTREQVKRCSPAYLPTPAGQFWALCGADESDEFLRHNALIEKAWGSRCVSVRQALVGLQHFSILESLCSPGSRAHTLAHELIFAPSSR